MTATQPQLVTVQTVTYNHEMTIRACIESVLAQTYQPIEIIAIDNASTDNTHLILQSLDLHYVANSQNIGYAAAHNQALALANGHYILTLNPDAILEANFVAQMVGYLEEHPQVGSASGLLLRVEELNEKPYIVDGAGLYIQRSRRQRLRYENMPYEAVPATITPIFGPDGAAAFYRRSMLDDIAIEGQYFDEDFFMHKEDVDLCWRAQLYGWSSVCIPQAIAHHVRGFRPGQRLGVGQAMRFWSVRNRYLKLIKNECWAHFWRDLPFILAYDVAILAYLLLFERASLKAYASMWQMRKKMLAKRRIIRQKTKRPAQEIRQQLLIGTPDHR